MIDILSLAIVREQSEEEFFRRSAEACPGAVGGELFKEIAIDMAEYREKLEKRRQKLFIALKELERSQGGQKPAAMPAEERDPVCQMRIQPEKCKLVSRYQGKAYYFCSPGCQKAFDLAPEQYIKV